MAAILDFQSLMILATVNLQVTSILPMKFESIALSVQEKKFKTAMAAIWDFLSQRFELFFIYKSPRCFLPGVELIGLSDQKGKGKIDFQDGRHLGFPIGTILAIFYIYKSSRCFLPIFKSTGPLAQENKRKKSFKMATILNFRSKQFKLF